MVNLKLPRGSTMTLLVKVRTANGDPYSLESGDILYFGVKRFPEHKHYVIEKTYTNADYDQTTGGYLVKITPEETQDFVFDDYWYDVAVQLANGDFYQIIPTSPLTILKNIVAKPAEEENDEEEEPNEG